MGNYPSTASLDEDDTTSSDHHHQHQHQHQQQYVRAANSRTTSTTNNTSSSTSTQPPASSSSSSQHQEGQVALLPSLFPISNYLVASSSSLPTTTTTTTTTTSNMLARRPSRERTSAGGAAGKKGESNRADWAWENSHWTKLKANKDKDRDVPKCRSGHACVQIGHYMYIIGGYSDGICFSDVYILDLNSHQWRHVENSGTVVQGRASHCCCIGPNNRDIYMFGGSGPCWGRTNLGDLCKFDTEKEEWSIMPLRGQMPPPGYGQSLCVYKHRLILFGGTCGSFFYNHLFEYDTQEQVWTRLQAQGRPPNPRYKHQAVVVGDSMYVLGGGQYSPEEGPMDIHKLNLETMVWTQHDLGCMAPQARIAHTCVVDEERSQILIFGGRSASEMKLQDLYAWDVKEEQLSLLAGSGPEDVGPPGREFHCACFFDGQMFIFGGSTGTRRMNDTWRYKLALEPPSLQVLAAHAVLQQVDDAEELRGRIAEEVVECLRTLRPNSFQFTAGLMR